jgi:hypothetical protein
MQVNLPAREYKDGLLDPLFGGYQYYKTPVTFSRSDGSSRTCMFDRNPTITSLPPYTYSPSVNPELVKKGWNKRFRPKRSYWPCPAGFTKTEDGMCRPAYPTSKQIFYDSEPKGEPPMMSGFMTKVPKFGEPAFGIVEKAYLGQMGSPVMHGRGDYAKSGFNSRYTHLKTPHIFYGY